MISTAQKMKKPLTENFVCVQSQSWAQQASSALYLQLNAQSITENLSILYVAWHGFIIAESPRKLKLVLQRKNEIPVKIFSNR